MRHLRARARLAGLPAMATLITTMLTGPMGLAAPGAHQSGAAGAGDTGISSSEHPRPVTLITGDRVFVQNGTAISISPGDGRDGMAFNTFTREDHTYVIPADARQLVSSGRLDRRLFDLTTLLEFGYDDARRESLPLIISHPEGRPAPRLAGTTGTRVLASIDAVAVAAERTSATWEALTDGTTTRRTAGGVSKIWLDGMRESTLEHSVPQIGAPTAWDAGFTGAGVTVAVLDSGVDQTHPDLVDREVAERNFTEAPDNVDDYGHGTHVASIVAGTGAKSGGKYLGVAPGVSILDGKVLDGRFGLDSWVIAGMEWAAEQGADIANLSLGAADTAELDPLEQAVNTLSAEHGTLFVIAAGNEGPDAGTIGSPGSAEAALTVGAVDREDQLAPFSSRGPRVGDGGVKPDITAPGVEIVAALHSAGTIGEPVADGYTPLSGTSMATPHVAGAAALLAQRHPDWTGAALKAALTASATPHGSLTAFEQGSGRVDVPKALAQAVVTEPTSLGLGTAAWPHDEPVGKELTYRNLGDAEVTLSLSVEATGPSGEPTDLFSLSAKKLTVPAGGEASVTVTADTALGSTGSTYSGRVVATAGESVTRTPVTISLEVESYDVTLNYLDENGEPNAAYSASLFGVDVDASWDPYDEDGSVKVRLAKGRYLLHSVVVTGSADDEHYSQIVHPGFVVAGPGTTTIDPRIAKPASVTPPVPARLRVVDLGYSAIWGHGGLISAFYNHDLSDLSTAQVGEPLPGMTLIGKVNTQWTSEDGSFYGLAWFTEGKIPSGFTRTVRQAELATLHADFGPATETVYGRRGLFPIHSSGETMWIGALTEVALPSRRNEYVTTEGAVQWMTSLLLDDRADESIEPIAILDSPAVRYRPGRTYPSRFNYGVFGPVLPEGTPPRSFRAGDEFSVSVPLFGDSSGNEGVSAVESGGTWLYQGDELVGESPQAGSGWFTGLSPAAKDYRLVTSATRPKTFDLTTAVSAEWTFSSGHVADDELVGIDLNVVRFLPVLDANNSAPAGRRFLVPMVLQDESGAVRRPRSITVEASYDDGATWKRVPVLANLVAALDHPSGARSVSLRASAIDQDGNTVRQTVIGAYKLRM